MDTERTKTQPPTPATPEEVQAFLEAPSSYPHGPERVDLLQTHISYVALAGRYVYKVKKPVDLGFVDFSTLDKRRHFCEEEVRLNRRLCARIYEGVVPLFREGETLAFEGEGPAVAYAVKMHRLSEEHFLDRKLARGEVTREDFDRVTEKLAAFYRERSSSDAIAEWGRTDNLRVSTEENFEQTRDHVGHTLSRPAFEAIRYYTDRFLDQKATLINRRRAEGHIVDGHGDLRLEHIHLTPDAVCIFDCIEFSERLRSVDVASDVGFLAMDLDVQGRPDLALDIAGQMAERLGDPDMLGMIDFYKCYRAYVRGKVESLRGQDEDLDDEERQEAREQAAHYFRWALQYATAGSGPAVIALMGRVGTGKTKQAQALGEALGWTVVSSDRVRKEEAGVPLRDRPEEAQRAELYTEEQTRQTYATLHERALECATEGHGTILDATFSTSEQREALREALKEQDIPYCFVELEAEDETLRERLRKREGGSHLSDARLEDFDMLNARYEAPGPLEDAYHFTAEATGDPAATTAEILRHLVRFELHHTND